MGEKNENKKKDGSCTFHKKTANRSSLFDQEKKRKKGTLFGRFFKHSENAKIRKGRQRGRERERDNLLARSREKRKCTNQTK